MITGVRVENGTAVLLTEKGHASTRIGNQYVCAGVSGTDLIAVDKQGVVNRFKIHGTGERVECIGSMGAKAYDAVSISMGGGLNFSITCSDGTVHYWANGQKTRTDTSNRTLSAHQAPEQRKEQIEQSSAEPTVVYADVPDGFMSGLAHRCKVLITEPIPGPWAKIIVWFTVISTVVAAGFLVANLDQIDQSKLPALICILIANVVLNYWLRNAIAKVLVRSWYGLPIVILGAIIGQSYPELGGFIVIAGVVAWLWPVWPLALILITVVGVILMAFSKTTPTMGNRQ